MIKVGVVGLGAVSDRIISLITQHPATTVTAVCDVDKARVDRALSKLGDVAGFTNYEELTALPELDLIYVSVPPKFHHAVVKSAIQHGKHILCEKPLANSLTEAEEMMQAAKAANIVHAMHFPLPYSNPVHELARRLQNGDIGQVRRIEVITQFPEWPRKWQQNAWVGGREQGGFILEVGVHFIQLTQYLFGSLHDVSSSVQYPADETACEQSFTATMSLKDGTPVVFSGFGNFGGQERVEFTVYGTNGVLSLTGWGALHHAGLGEALQPIPSAADAPALIDSIVDAIHGKPALLCDFEVGFHAQQILEQVRHRNK